MGTRDIRRISMHKVKPFFPGSPRSSNTRSQGAEDRGCILELPISESGCRIPELQCSESVCCNPNRESYSRPPEFINVSLAGIWLAVFRCWLLQILTACSINCNTLVNDFLSAPFCRRRQNRICGCDLPEFPLLSGSPDNFYLQSAAGRFSQFLTVPFHLRPAL